MVFIVYGLVNITVTFVTGEPVYSAISWDSVEKWLLGSSMVIVALIFYVFWFFMTKLKFKWMKMHDQIIYDEGNTMVVS